MKKINLFLMSLTMFFLAISTTVQSQNLPNRIFKKGQTDLFTTIGLIPTFLADDGRQTVPPISIGIDKMIGANFSLGGSIGHSSTTSQNFIFSDGIEGQWRNQYYSFAARAALHVTKFDNISIYGGFTAAYHVSKITPTKGEMEDIMRHRGIEEVSSKFIPGGFVGFKYAVAKRVSVIAELGYGVSLFRTGVGFKL